MAVCLLSPKAELLLKAHRKPLCDRIHLDRSILLDELQTAEVITFHEADTIKMCGTTNSRKVGELLDILLTKTEKDYEVFCYLLSEHGMKHFVTHYFSDRAVDHLVKKLQKNLSDNFVSSYVDDMFSFNDEDNRIDLRDIYVPIQWVQYKPTPAKVKVSSMETYLELFDEVSSNSRFLLRGEPTAGKTTFLRKLCRDWASLHTEDEEAELDVKQKLSEFSLVLPVILRAVQPDTDLSDTIQRQTGISDTDIHTMMYILNTEPNKVIFILDGLDEFNLETNKEITGIMEKREYKKSTCIITTRPEAADKAKHWTHVIYKQAELLGFSKENIKKFIEKFFKSHEEGVKIADELYNLIYPPFDYSDDANINWLKETDQLQKLAVNPGRLGMLCSIYSYNQEVITNTTKLYEEFSLIILSKWEKKQNKQQTQKSRILHKYKDVMYQFGKLAYKQEDNGDLKLTFTMEDLEECISPELFNCGFIYKSQPLHRFEDCQVGFIHKSVQEYMAAYYVCHEENGQALDRLLKDFVNEERFYNVAPVLKFAIYSGSKEQIEHVIDYSTGTPQILFRLLKFLEHYNIPLHQEPVFLSPFYADGDYLENNCFVQLPACMIDTKLSESTFRSRWRGIKQSDDQKSWILTWPSDTKKIIIEDFITGDDDDVNNLEEDEILIASIHRFPLFINGESGSLSRMRLITKGNIHIINVCKNVTMVNLSGSKLHSQAKWLNSLLLNVPNCTELNMKSCGLSAKDIKHLCEETKGRDLKIEILNLENNDFVTEGTDALVRFVRQCPRLREIFLTSHKVAEEYISTQVGIINNVMNIVLLVDGIKKVVKNGKLFALHIDYSIIVIDKACHDMIGI